MKSSRVRRGKTRNASRFGAAISAGLDGGLVALRERLIALGVGTHPALGRRAGERAAHLRRRAERERSLGDFRFGRHERAGRHHRPGTDARAVEHRRAVADQTFLAERRGVDRAGVAGRPAAVATATPPHRFTQSEILTLAGYRDEERSGFFRRSDIEGRYLWMDPATFRPNESVDEMSARSREGALELGESAARRALERAGWDAVDVDFIATTTCTGRLTPSLDAHLIARLGCRADIQRVHVGDTGCASAMVALQQASN